MGKNNSPPALVGIEFIAIFVRQYECLPFKMLIPFFSKRRLSLAAAYALSLSALLFFACKKDSVDFKVLSIEVGATPLDITTGAIVEELPFDQSVKLGFNLPVDPQTVQNGLSLTDESGGATAFTYTLENDNYSIVLTPSAPLKPKERYAIAVKETLENESGKACTPLQIQFITREGQLNVTAMTVNGADMYNLTPRGVDFTCEIRVRFSQAIDPTSIASNSVILIRPGQSIPVQWAMADHDSTIVVTTPQPLGHWDKYTLYLGENIKGPAGFKFSGLSRSFFTRLDPTPKFPLISDEALLDLVQSQTFKYFWDFGHPVSGLARERNTSGDVVATGGSGFGVMSIIVGIERGFITRQQGVERWQKIVDFLTNNAQRYHGAYPHWLNGATGATIPFSTNDDGGDLVETSFLIQGLLTVRQYLDDNNPDEAQLKSDIQAIWEGVEWDWYTRGGQNVLYWHWSPNHGWAMNFQLRGYIECLITYVLAASSPTHPISAEVYHQGWAQNGAIVNGNTYYGYPLPLGFANGGPLFFAHYSFTGLDPRHLQDNYANYWTQNQNHSLINWAYCVANPLHMEGYAENCWGLTASDDHTGYRVHEPNNDNGCISPTAALSSMPYTPEQSIAAMKFFYYQLGDKLWGDYGFYDAFTPQHGWFATSTIAIDQGPIVVMIENHRTGKLWDLFMSSPEIAVGAATLGFTY